MCTSTSRCNPSNRYCSELKSSGYGSLPLLVDNTLHQIVPTLAVGCVTKATRDCSCIDCVHQETILMHVNDCIDKARGQPAKTLLLILVLFESSTEELGNEMTS